MVNAFLKKHRTAIKSLFFRCNYDDLSRLLTRETSIICLILFLMIVLLSAKHTLIGINLYSSPLQSMYTRSGGFLNPPVAELNSPRVTSPLAKPWLSSF